MKNWMYACVLVCGFAGVSRAEEPAFTAFVPSGQLSFVLPSFEAFQPATPSGVIVHTPVYAPPVYNYGTIPPMNYCPNGVCYPVQTRPFRFFAR